MLSLICPTTSVMCSDKLFYAIIFLHTPTQHSLVSHPSNKSKGTGSIKLWIEAFPMTTLLHIKGKMIWAKWACKMRQMTICFAVFYTMKYPKSFYASLSTTSPPLINPKTTPSISKGNYSPLSSERGWGWGWEGLCLRLYSLLSSSITIVFRFTLTW